MQVLFLVQLGMTSIGLPSGIWGEAVFSDGLVLSLISLAISEGAAFVSEMVIAVIVIAFIAIILGAGVKTDWSDRFGTGFALCCAIHDLVFIHGKSLFSFLIFQQMSF